MALSREDVTDIQQLYAAYCLYADDGNGAAFADLFTVDGSIESGGDPMVGTEKLARFADRVPTRTPGIRHVVVNVHAVGDGDEAQGRGYLIAFTAGGKDSILRMTGQYRDVFRRVDSVWKFAERHFKPDV